MELPNDIPTVMHNVSNYFMLNGAEIPEEQREQLLLVMGPGISPVDFVVKVAKTLYEVRDEISDDGKLVAAQAANLASMNGWHGMTQEGNDMVNTLGDLIEPLELEEPVEEPTE